MKLRRIESGHYQTLDGQWNVLRVDHYTTCDAAHPDRNASGGYCWGGEEHPATTWVIEDSNGQECGWCHDTKREAVAYLLGMVRKAA